MKMIWTVPFRFFDWEHIVTMKKKIVAMIVLDTYRGIRVIGWLLELENFESDSRNLEIYSVATRKPMQLRKKFEFG